jgi:hypothetical protein
MIGKKIEKKYVNLDEKAMPHEVMRIEITNRYMEYSSLMSILYTQYLLDNKVDSDLYSAVLSYSIFFATYLQHITNNQVLQEFIFDIKAHRRIMGVDKLFEIYDVITKILSKKGLINVFQVRVPSNSESDEVVEVEL